MAGAGGEDCGSDAEVDEDCREEALGWEDDLGWDGLRTGCGRGWEEGSE